MLPEYLPIAEDIDWLRGWLVAPKAPSDQELRRASATLRLLLVNGAVTVAWKACGFPRSPKLVGPDLLAILQRNGLDPRYAVACLAGGARLDGLRLASFGAFRVKNPETGIGPDAEAGFAVLLWCLAANGDAPGPWNDLILREWHVEQYLDSAGAILQGKTISRREIIKYCANQMGGAHLAGLGHPRSDDERNKFIAEFLSRIDIDSRDGFFFELLAIGQAIGRSADLTRLAEAIRAK